jgi:Ca2+-binding EF-hand superfamily protein
LPGIRLGERILESVAVGLGLNKWGNLGGQVMRRFVSEKLLCWSLLVLCLTSAGFAEAAQEKAKGKKKPKDLAAQFSRLDKNNNQELTLSEYVANKTGKKEEHARAAFKKHDRNGDGKLSLGEFTAEVKKKSKAKKAD